MSKYNFMCSLCDDVIHKGFWTCKKHFHKYECPEHGEICKKHIKKHIFGGPTCKVCGRHVMKYTKTKDNWRQS